MLGMLCETNLCHDGQRSDDVCFARRDLSQHECVGRMITCAQQSVTSAVDKCADSGVVAKVKLCAVCSHSPRT